MAARPGKLCPMVATLPFATCAVAVLALLVAEWRGSTAGVWCAKPVASLAFVWVALESGATGSSYGAWLLAGLLLCLAGDLLLVPTDRPAAFKAGILAFLLGHVAYAVAFLALEPSKLGFVGAGFLLFGLLRPVLRWLRPHLPPDMVVPVHAYVIVIGAMAALAVSVTLAGAPRLVAAGALAFAASDVAVARDRFVAPGFPNRAWGLPLYYAAQCALAATPSLLG
ncbi:MAG: lysoplasmalogenase [Steroidobacteraceae bacterium]